MLIRTKNMYNMSYSFKNHYIRKHNLFLQQTREYSLPVMIMSGMIHFYTLTQYWNPYFPREKIYKLSYIGNFLLVTGLILP